MNFIELQGQRINLDLIIRYYPVERYVSILNKDEKWYEIHFENAGNHCQQLVVNYQKNVANRDVDLKTLDFVCASHKSINPNNNKNTPTPQKKENELTEDLDLGMVSCPQCNEEAWDGYICHLCGAKNI